MSAQIPTEEPTEAVAGDTWKWDRSDFAAYPILDGWRITYAFRGAVALDLTSEEITVVGSVHQVRVPALKTGPLPEGTYRWAAYATLGSERYEVLTGKVVVRDNLAGAVEGRSTAERELALINAAIADLLANNVTSFSLNGRTVTVHDLPTLTRMRGGLRYQLLREQNPGVSFPLTHEVVFDRA